ncbi:cohesin subunit SA-2 [Lampris incognitus]|uniref:cohesin subunit SA-2 n=1 Tax=Lampris incognitus TaxID=2546036 RepID=UPI0024B58459|nr:cohesin subunit SA-2 [Lampris incognitus]
MALDYKTDCDSLEELDDISDIGSDVEFQIASMARRKRVASAPGVVPPKRPRRETAVGPTPNTSCSPIPSPPCSSTQSQQPSLGTSRRASLRAVPRNKGNQGITAGEIYEAICSGKSAIVAVVDEWLESYKEGQEEGLLVLINLIVRCCGCKGVVSREMFDTMQNVEVISMLTKEFDEDSVNYPLCSPGHQWKRFKASLCEFVQVLVRSCQNGVLHDEYLFSSLLALLIGLSDSQVRAFRHTSTLLAMKLMTGLMKVSVVVYAQLQTSQRRYNIESSKSAQDRATVMLEDLQAMITELQENKEELSSLTNGTFRGVFVHRYRDSVAEIRAACIEELGVWLREDPEEFLNDQYLKYLGWMLHDKQSSVRLQCVHALQGLYQKRDFIGRLELFFSRFKGRILAMVLDKDPDVAVEVIHLLLLIQQYDREEECLSEEECSNIYPLVFVSHHGLASAAGAFFYSKLKSMMASEYQELVTGGNKAAFINMLISFYIQCQFHDHGAYLVDSLWGVAGSELRDWETMTSLLLHESEEKQGLIYEEEGVLIELMMCAIRQAAEANLPVGRAHGKRILSTKDKKTQAQDRRRITTHFIPLLPQLLAKYSADVEKVCLLLKAPLYFDLETYSSSRRLEKYLDLLLSQICSIVEKHTEASVLEACTRLACALCSNSFTFSARAQRAFGQLLDCLTECFTTHFNDVLQGTADEDEMYSAATAFKRIAAFSSAKDLTSLELFDPCLQLLKRGVKSRDFDKEFMVPALKCAAFHLIWARANVTNSTFTEVQLKRLKKEMHSFCSVCKHCLSLGQAEIRDQAFELLCDLLLLYSTGSVRSEPSLRLLASLPSDSLRSELAAFLLDFIFTDPEDDELTADKPRIKHSYIHTSNQEYGECSGSSQWSNSSRLPASRHRWLENVEVAKRALQILPSLKTYISAAKSKKVTEPCTKSFKKTEIIVHDDLFPAKLNFFLMVAREITPFLKLYQTDKPMLPFMCNDLTTMLKSLMERFVKSSVMKNATNPVKLLKVDHEDTDNHMDVTKLKVGFATERAFEEHVKNSGAERLRLEFRQSCARQEEEEEKMKIAALQRKRIQLAGYCKLVIHGVLDLSSATDLFKHYSKFYKEFGDIIKETLSKSKLISPVQSAKTICLTLQQLFSERISNNSSGQDLGEIRDLAKKLAMSFGIDLHRVRKPLVSLHRDGIDFAFRNSEQGRLHPPNLAFLEILSEFSFKLLHQDRIQLSEFLKAEYPIAAFSWPLVRMYKCSLEYISLSKTGEEAGREEKNGTAKRKKTQGSVSSDSSESWLDSSSIRNLSTPPLTSTAVRGQKRPPPHTQPGPTRFDKGSFLYESEDEFSNRLCLIEEDDAEGQEEEEAEIEEFERDSDQDSAYTLPSTRHTSISQLEDFSQ